MILLLTTEPMPMCFFINSSDLIENEISKKIPIIVQVSSQHIAAANIR